MEMRNRYKYRKLNFERLALVLLFWGLVAGTKIEAVTFYLNHYSARATALGEAYSTIGEDADTMFFNPASLVNIESKSFQYTMADLYSMDINLDVLSFATYLGKNRGALGIAYAIVSSGNQPVTDVYRYPEYGGQTGEGIVMDSQDEPLILGYFSENRSAFYLSYANYLYNRLAMGVSIKRYAYYYNGDQIEDKYINALIHTKANSWSIDWGFYWKLFDNLSLGGAVSDLMSTGFKWNTETPYVMELNPQITIGALYSFVKNLWVSLDITRIMGTQTVFFKSGVEYKIMRIIPVRAGYNNGIINFGTGIICESDKFLKYIFKNVPSNFNKKYLKIDYALILNSLPGYTHKFTIGLSF